MDSVPAIKKWKPQHEKIVRLHIAGMTNLEIAELLDFTPMRISQVLNDPHGQRLIKQAILSMRKRMEADIEDRLVLHAEKAVERIEETLDGEFLLGSKAKKHQDNVSLSILKGTGFLSRDIGPSREAGPSGLDEKLVERVATALEKSNEARELHSEPVDADYEIVEEGAES